MGKCVVKLLVTEKEFLLRTILRHKSILSINVLPSRDGNTGLGRRNDPKTKNRLVEKPSLLLMLLAGSPVSLPLLKLSIFAGYATGIWNF